MEETLLYYETKITKYALIWAANRKYYLVDGEHRKEYKDIDLSEVIDDMFNLGITRIIYIDKYLKESIIQELEEQNNTTQLRQFEMLIEHKEKRELFENHLFGLAKTVDDNIDKVDVIWDNTTLPEFGYEHSAVIIRYKHNGYVRNINCNANSLKATAYDLFRKL